MRYERRQRLAAAALRVILAVEDAAQVGLVRLLGWREITVLPFIGYGTPERVRARGRVVLGRALSRPAAAADLVDHQATAHAPSPGRWAPWRTRWTTFR
jgi:hypothetical protein